MAETRKMISRNIPQMERGNLRPRPACVVGIPDGEGATPADLLKSYPHLTEDDIQAAIIYAADTLAHEETVLVEPKA